MEADKVYSKLQAVTIYLLTLTHLGAIIDVCAEQCILCKLTR